MNTETTTAKTTSVQLIKGTFNAAESKEVLMDIFRSKINFHNMKIWASEEMSGKPCIHSQQRLIALRQSIVQLEEFIKMAAADERKITIESVIKLKLK